MPRVHWLADYSLPRQRALLLVMGPTDRADQHYLCTAVTHCTGEMTPATGTRKHEQSKGALHKCCCRVLSWNITDGCPCVKSCQLSATTPVMHKWPAGIAVSVWILKAQGALKRITEPSCSAQKQRKCLQVGCTWPQTRCPNSYWTYKEDELHWSHES